MRDGWLYSERVENGIHDASTIFEKPIPRGWTIRKICHEQTGAPKGKGCYWDEHVLLSRAGIESKFPNWEWAEMGGRDIVFAENGCLYRIGIKNASELGDADLIHDFNDYKFEKLEVPY
jgi:hypothetical protein